MAVAALAFYKLIGVSSGSAETQRQREIIQGLKGPWWGLQLRRTREHEHPFFSSRCRWPYRDVGSTGSRFSDMSVLVEMAE